MRAVWVMSPTWWASWKRRLRGGSTSERLMTRFSGS